MCRRNLHRFLFRARGRHPAGQRSRHFEYRDGRPSVKWRTISILLVAELLAMGVWFSASAVAPALAAAWSLDDSGKAWLTMSVQMGFVAGALLSALLNLADRIPAHILFACTAVAAAASTASIVPWAHGLATAVFFRSPDFFWRACTR